MCDRYDSEGWIAYLRLEDPPRPSPVTTVGRFATACEAMVATDEVWGVRRRMTVQSAISSVLRAPANRARGGEVSLSPPLVLRALERDALAGFVAGHDVRRPF
jgi:hypothetical protein